MKKIVIFGTGQLADLAHFYFTHDSDREIAGFALDADYRGTDTHRGLPVVDFEDAAAAFDPSDHDFFLPISFKQMNGVRRDRYVAAKAMGYACASYVSSKATVWQPENIGENCFIFEDNTIQPFTTIGDNVVMWSGNHIGHHSVIEDHVFITSHVVVSGACRIGAESFLGVNAAIRDEIHVAPRTLVGMGATITADTQDGDVWLAPRAIKAKAKSDRIGATISPKSGTTGSTGAKKAQ